MIENTLNSTTASLASKKTEDTFITEAMTARHDRAHDHAGDLLVKSRDLLGFLADRLKTYLRDRGARHDLLDAVFALGEDDLVMIVSRINALEKFLATEDGASLLAGYKRATNILKAEEKKDGAGAFEKHPEANLRIEPQEQRSRRRSTAPNARRAINSRPRISTAPCMRWQNSARRWTPSSTM